MECQKGKASGTGQCGWNRERGFARGLVGVGNGAAQMERQKREASGTGQLRWKGAGEGSGKEKMKVECPKSGLLTKQMRRWQIVQE